MFKFCFVLVFFNVSVIFVSEHRQQVEKWRHLVLYNLSDADNEWWICIKCHFFIWFWPFTALPLTICKYKWNVSQFKKKNSIRDMLLKIYFTKSTDTISNHVCAYACVWCNCVCVRIRAWFSRVVFVFFCAFLWFKWNLTFYFFFLSPPNISPCIFKKFSNNLRSDKNYIMKVKEGEMAANHE